MLKNGKELTINGTIFDIDGTLLNTLTDIGYAVNSVLCKYNLPKHSLGRYKYFIGDGLKELVRRSLPTRFNGSFEKIYFDIKKEYKSNLNSQTVVYEGINELLEYLISRNIKIGINTNKPHEFAIKCIRKYFDDYDILTIGSNNDRPLKPDPSGVLEIINQFDLNPKNCVMIGDSNVDIFTAKNANIISFGALWGFRSQFELLKSGANYLFENPIDIIRFIKSI